MTDHNQKVEPARFEPASAPAVEPRGDVARPSTPQGTQGDANRWLLPALGGLLLVALLVFFWLPSLVESPEVELEAPAAPVARSAPAVEPASPWSDAQQARERYLAADCDVRELDVAAFS